MLIAALTELTEEATRAADAVDRLRNRPTVTVRIESRPTDRALSRAIDGRRLPQTEKSLTKRLT